jgi:hypothetical protein
MRAELQQSLFEKYPEIFKDKDKPMTETCMCWGIETGDGWYSLLNQLCATLQFYTDRNKYPQVVARQVKEKFGGLRFYYRFEETEKSAEHPDRSTKFLEGMIAFAEVISENTCDECGLPGKINDGPWFSVRCDECRD